MRQRRVLASVVALAVLAGGCGVLGPEEEEAASAPSADEQALRSAVLTIGDLPTGWTGTPPEEADAPVSADLDVQGAAAADPACAPLVALDEGSSPPPEGSPVPAEVESLTFSSPDERLGVEQDLESFPTAELATELVTVIAAPEMPACLVAMFEEMADAEPLDPDDPELTVTFAAEPLAVPAVGDQAVAIRVNATVASPSKGTLLLPIDFVVVRSGRVVTTLLYLAAESPFPPELAAQLTDTAVGRLPAL